MARDQRLVLGAEMEPQATPDAVEIVFAHAGFDGLRAVLLSHMMGRGWGKMLERKLPEVIAGASVAAGC